MEQYRHRGQWRRLGIRGQLHHLLRHHELRLFHPPPIHTHPSPCDVQLSLTARALFQLNEAFSEADGFSHKEVWLDKMALYSLRTASMRLIPIRPDPDTHHHVRRILAPPRTVPLESLPSLPGDTRAGILELLRRRGLRAISVDVTTPDVALSGMRVVRVIVPGLYPNAPAAFPFLGGRRLYDEPAAMGWLAHPLQAAQLVRAPLPHS